MSRRSFVTVAALAAVVLAAFGAAAGSARAATACTPTGFVRDSINLTAALINPAKVTGTVNATGCNIGVYYGPGSTGQVNKADISGASYYGVVNNGGNVSVMNSSVHNIGDNPFSGTQHGVGIYWAYGSPNKGEIGNNAVYAYQKGGIVVNGGTANVHGNTVTGLGPISFNAQNGIQMAFGGGGMIHDNTVSGNAYTGGNPSTPGDANVNTDATGILVFGGCGDPVSTPDVSGNKLSQNDIGIYYVNYNADCTAAPATPTKGNIHDNKLSNSQVTNTLGNLDGRGYQAGILEFGNGDEIHNNAISGAGYAPTDSSTEFILPIDIRGSMNVKSHGNKFGAHPYNG
jgi:hypothetical protein